ncbi:hypothetical protein VP1G_10514 [Cytospora mali]|uniref:DUF7791 domain-containing protein n=1 Tax=Cytospora mali TaxID=578113 RepID=A0A194UNS8_CYTMA|nr:hypothetical protein VP1G_10514 [Valsa mali var. pyri (nom. inval.)]
MNKAQGVFLWVALVVKSLREGMENGLSCADLIHEVDVLPDELESLYRHIIRSMGKSARRRAYQTFAIIIALKEYHNYRISLLAYSFLDDYERDENFFMKEAGSFELSSLIGKLGRERSISSKKKLAGWCKGLVEPYNGDKHQLENNEGWDFWSLELDFTHRSVLEFLNSEDVKLDMKLSLNGFNHIDSISNLLVADVLVELQIEDMIFNRVTQISEKEDKTTTTRELDSFCEDDMMEDALINQIEQILENAPETAVGAKKDCSLRQFIELCSFHNNERILQMIDAQLGADERNRTETENHSPESHNVPLAQHDPPQEEDEEYSYDFKGAIDIVACGAGALNGLRQLMSVVSKSQYFRYGLAALIGAIVSMLVSHFQRYLG